MDHRLVICIPDGAITYQKPPFKSSASPFAVPEPESPLKVYSGHPS
jgi:hypothetical protein